jgi:hypothetical protein
VPYLLKGPEAHVEVVHISTAPALVGVGVLVDAGAGVCDPDHHRVAALAGASPVQRAAVVVLEGHGGALHLEALPAQQPHVCRPVSPFVNGTVTSVQAVEQSAVQCDPALQRHQRHQTGSSIKLL